MATETNGGNLTRRSNARLQKARYVAVLLVALSFGSGCAARSGASPHSSRAEVENADAAAVYAAVISNARQRMGKPVVIAAETFRPEGSCVPSASAQAGEWQSAVDDYGRKTQTQHTITSELPLPRSLYVVRPQAEILRRSRSTGKEIGYIAVSRVAFDSTGTRAIVHRMHLCSLYADCGDGSDIFLQRRDGQWHVIDTPGDVKGCHWIS